MERFAPCYLGFFPASTVLNAGIAGDTAGAILYRVEVMNIPSSVSHISLLCGTNNLCSHSFATISSTLTEILFLLWRKCPTTYIHLFPLLPRFDHLQTHVAATNSCIVFRVRNCFQNLFLFTNCPPPYLTKICTGLTEYTLQQKAMTLLSGGFTNAWPCLTQLNHNQTHPYCPSFCSCHQRYWLASPSCPITTFQQNYTFPMQIQQT